MTYRYLRNLRDSKAEKSSKIHGLKLQLPKPKFKNKADYREWCSKPTTDHVFYSCVEGRAPSKRVSNDNPVHMIHGVVADYDSPINWKDFEKKLEKLCVSTPPPTWASRTQSGYLRLVWEFDSPIPIDPSMYESFMRQINKSLKMDKLFAGFDKTSLKPNQYFELGEDWIKTGCPLTSDVVHTCLSKAVNLKPPESSDTAIPLDVVATEVESRFPNRWFGEFEVGSRGPLFWIDDGIDRDGCQVVEDGIVCYSDRAGQGFMSWSDIFGGAFVKDYETKKLSTLLDEYWFNGRSFFKLLYGNAVSIPKEQLLLELRQAGFSVRVRRGRSISEVDEALLSISNNNRIDDIAPVVFSSDRIVSYNGSRILNCSNLVPVDPDSDGDPAKWPFIHQWLNQLFVDSSETPALDYFYSWMQRFYTAVLERIPLQGQALLLVGPTGRGKSLLSNKIISGLVGGFSDASDYLSGQTKFNKDLGRVASWVIDDTTSAASFQDQRRATELLKRAVANPRVEYMAKYADAMSLPWTGRVTLSLNMDANSLSVIPSLDTSNRDKLMALLISTKSTKSFPPNSQLEATIEQELPHFGKFLLDWKIPKPIEDVGRFGVKSFIDLTIADAAYDNSSRSSIAELVEFFCKRCREIAPDEAKWKGTLTEFQVQIHELNNGRDVGSSRNLEFCRRGMITLEEGSRVNKNIRPVISEGRGGGKVWSIDLNEIYDIGYKANDERRPSDQEE
mgnify:FL=1|jgi:hypothetical protein